MKLTADLELLVYNLTRKTWLADGGADVLNLEHVEQASDGRLRIVLRFSDTTDQFWVQVSGSRLSCACLLAGDGPWRPRYELLLATAPDEQWGSLSGGPRYMRANLAIENDGPLGEVATLWLDYRKAGPDRAARILMGHLSLTDDRLLALSGDWVGGSPLATAIAFPILLRARDARYGDASTSAAESPARHLAVPSATLADTRVLWVEYELQELTAGPLPIELIDAHLEALESTVPITSEALGFASAQVEDFIQFGDSGESRRSRLQLVQQRLDRALRYYRGSTLFTSFADEIGILTPGIVAAEAAASAAAAVYA